MEGTTKRLIRSLKCYAMGYSKIQKKVIQATSNEQQCPSLQLVDEIVKGTFDRVKLFEILVILEKRLNDKGKYWKHILKTLMLIECFLLHGSDQAFEYYRKNAYTVSTLKEFQYIDEYGIDQGVKVRSKAKIIAAMLNNKARLRELGEPPVSNKRVLSNSFSSELEDLFDSSNKYRSKQRKPSMTNFGSSKGDIYSAKRGRFNSVFSF